MQEDESSRSLFGNMQWQSDVLAIPLFGISEIQRNPVATGDASQYWTFEPGCEVGRALCRRES